MEKLISKILETIKENKIIGNDIYSVDSIHFTNQKSGIYVEMFLLKEDKEDKGE